MVFINKQLTERERERGNSEWKLTDKSLAHLTQK